MSLWCVSALYEYVYTETSRDSFTLCVRFCVVNTIRISIAPVFELYGSLYICPLYTVFAVRMLGSTTHNIKHS